MSKPRDYFIPESILNPSYASNGQTDERLIHVREVVPGYLEGPKARPIDWAQIFVDYCLQTQSMDNFELIQQLVEAQLRGDNDQA